MNQHTCLLCMGSNYERERNMAHARETLEQLFANIRFGEEMETEAIGNGFHSPFSNQLILIETHMEKDEIRDTLKEIEQQIGRSPSDKAQGIVKIDIDFLTFDHQVLKAKDLQLPYIKKGMEAFSPFLF
ncbi:MAG: 2-amino-4-hydroxy-6-hydroxymethyldihydropteridine diphosphokinase [Bacteroides sp]|nr:2-amino-4-hydroxy-6-hydroxymethyldihydropteridine diphosphokinase [Bacteroides sp.]